jgi:hypothetical protein
MSHWPETFYKNLSTATPSLGMSLCASWDSSAFAEVFNHFHTSARHEGLIRSEPLLSGACSSLFKLLSRCFVIQAAFTLLSWGTAAKMLSLCMRDI